MPRTRVNGVELFYEVTGEGDPLVLVHGSWVDHHSWRLVAPRLAGSYRVVVYDRRGHSGSERPPGQGTRREDEDDLAALIETLDLAPAHVAGSSFGGSTALGLAARRPELFRTLAAHEPPLLGLVEGDEEAQAARLRLDAVFADIRGGDHAAAARRFVEEVVSGPGEWGRVPEPIRETFIANAPTFLDEQSDPSWAMIDLPRLAAGYTGPALLTTGSEGMPWFPGIVAKLGKALRGARVVTLEGAGHVPHVTHPDAYVDTLTGFLRS
ncbi:MULTISPECIES: alpha/beta fold hydrolase [unclassified Streptomyces]|uniref:alpha/beta fold hydrolase n=1 Tax=unclassified Streptomyces TaxID=2593676 RepID=UPI002E35A151|nr:MULTISPECIES: alpha/beta hydrolase [unclassified Streptomyces]WUC64871.1 alpha/beta hydrolase [Streptomyces sp. NBC_00539]